MKNTELQIKRIEKSEVDIVVEMFNDYRIFYKQVSDLELARNFLQERLDLNESIIYVAYLIQEKAKTPVGFIQLYPKILSVSAKKNWHIGDLFTKVEHRRLGVGRLLLKTALIFAREESSAMISLNTAKDNFNAQKLYENFGFSKNEMSEYYYYTYDV